MDDFQIEPKNSISNWQVVTAVLVFSGLSYWIAGQNPTPPSLKSAMASEKDSNSKEKADSNEIPSSNAAEAERQPKVAAPLAPSPKRALQRIQATKEVRELLKDPKDKLVEAEKVEGLGVWTMKYQHLYNGVEVLGSMATYHSGPGGEKIRTRLKDVNIKTEPKLSAQEAEKLALQDVGSNSHASAAPQLKILPASRPQSAKLIYWVQVRDENSLPHEVWIDAQSGNLISHMARTGETLETQGKGTL